MEQRIRLISKALAMKIIDLSAFARYDCKDIYAWLLQQQETVFHIRMEKGFMSAIGDEWDMIFEYEAALLFGEKLSALSDDFGYYTPSEISRSSFAFDLITGNMEELADTLFYMISIIADTDSSHELFEQYNNQRYDFWDKYSKEETEPVCQGLLHTMDKILNYDSVTIHNAINAAPRELHSYREESKGHIIDLFEFADYECYDIFEYLLMQEETVFRIRVDKHFTAPAAEKTEIVTEYFDALYFGEKLSKLSNDFVYYTPSEYSQTPFSYDLITNDMLKLANTLYYLIRGIVLDESSVDIMDKYQDEKDVFWEKYCNDEFEPVCQGLLHIMEKYQEEEQ